MNLPRRVLAPRALPWGAPWALPWVAVAPWALPLVAYMGGGCGSDPYCGDGHVDVGELCDDGNNDETDVCLNDCTPRPVPTLTVKWEFDSDEDLGFSGDSCTDTGAAQVEATIDGPMTASKSDNCAFRQVQFADIPAGTYDVSLDITDSGGNGLTSGKVTDTIEFGGGNEEATVVVPWTAWKTTYDGNLFFRVQWDGMDCADATTEVVSQRLSLTRDGEYLAAQTKAGASLQGDVSACYPASMTEPQTLLEVPFGPVTLDIEGLDVDMNVVYQGSFDTFIGAGLLNPEQLFNVLPAM